MRTRGSFENLGVIKQEKDALNPGCVVGKVSTVHQTLHLFVEVGNGGHREKSDHGLFRVLLPNRVIHCADKILPQERNIQGIGRMMAQVLKNVFLVIDFHKMGKSQM